MLCPKMSAIIYSGNCSHRSIANAPGCADFVIFPASVVFYIDHESGVAWIRARNRTLSVYILFPVSSIVYIKCMVSRSDTKNAFEGSSEHRGKYVSTTALISITRNHWEPNPREKAYIRISNEHSSARPTSGSVLSCFCNRVLARLFSAPPTQARFNLYASHMYSLTSERERQKRTSFSYQLLPYNDCR